MGVLMLLGGSPTTCLTAKETKGANARLGDDGFTTEEGEVTEYGNY
jgi:hypothetical protein